MIVTKAQTEIEKIHWLISKETMKQGKNQTISPLKTHRRTPFLQREWKEDFKKQNRAIITKISQKKKIEKNNHKREPSEPPVQPGEQIRNGVKTKTWRNYNGRKTQITKTPPERAHVNKNSGGRHQTKRKTRGMLIASISW